MADKPILFSGPMVRAILDGRKTQTRRVTEMLRQDDPSAKLGILINCDHPNEYIGVRFKARYRAGDRLWVRETYWEAGKNSLCDFASAGWDVAYRATDDDEFTIPPIWKPSIFMPRRLSRITLTVTDVRVQRLQDINELDALMEGVTEFRNPAQGPLEGTGKPPLGETYRTVFSHLWNSINGKPRKPDGPDISWKANPWVVAYTFKPHFCNIDQVDKAS